MQVSTPQAANAQSATPVLDGSRLAAPVESSPRSADGTPVPQRVLADTLIPASVLPQPSEAERQGPKASGAPVNLTLEGFAPQSAAPPADEA